MFVKNLQFMYMLILKCYMKIMEIETMPLRRLYVNILPGNICFWIRFLCFILPLLQFVHVYLLFYYRFWHFMARAHILAILLGHVGCVVAGNSFFCAETSNHFSYSEFLLSNFMLAWYMLKPYVCLSIHHNSLFYIKKGWMWDYAINAVW